MILQNQSGKRKMAIFKKTSMSKLLIIALVIVLLILTLPLVPETRIVVVTDRDTIENVSVETPRVPLVVLLIPSPSVGTGAYTISVSVTKNSILVFNSTLRDVPSGDFTFTWVSNGQPEAGTYRVTVQLFRANTQVDTYSLSVDFG